MHWLIYCSYSTLSGFSLEITYGTKEDKQERVLAIMSQSILRPSSNRSPYIFTLVQKVKNRAYKIHAFKNEAVLCQDSESNFI